VRPDQIGDNAGAFLRGIWERGEWAGPEPDRVLATVLFTDIVDSTAKLAELGDRRRGDLLTQRHARVRQQLARFRGREVDTAGDGFFASFDGPARAIRCAPAIVDAVGDLGIEVRAGLHTGECEQVGGKVGGIAVHIGARVAANAGRGEVVVSRTVRDLVACSGIEFEERGAAELKGISGSWELFRVVVSDCRACSPTHLHRRRAHRVREPRDRARRYGDPHAEDHQGDGHGRCESRPDRQHLLGEDHDGDDGHPEEAHHAEHEEHRHQGSRATEAVEAVGEAAAEGVAGLRADAAVLEAATLERRHLVEPCGHDHGGRRVWPAAIPREPSEIERGDDLVDAIGEQEIGRASCRERV